MTANDDKAQEQLQLRNVARDSFLPYNSTRQTEVLFFCVVIFPNQTKADCICRSQCAYTT